MIKEFNISTSGTANIYGEHYAANVYAKDVVIHPDDVAYGILTCDELFIGEAPSLETLNYDDRIYKGVLHCRDVLLRKNIDVQEDI